MRFILLLLIILVITPLAECFLPWWMIAVVPFLAAVAMNLRGGASFLAGFVGIGAFWFTAALMKDIPNAHLLSQRMAHLFKLGDYGIFLYVVAFIGALIGGLASWAGALIRVRKH